ncbi:MAG TPA: plastocyanin/azurin family copper-binding protein [Acidimicrobiales bacterium]|jgi:plastocyanin|nr:plastocyanin/azurin family copper-binding protein [Acidimicrobiales bacterium]
MKRLPLFAAALGLVAGACGGGSGSGSATTETTAGGPPAMTATVQAKDLAFKPSKARIAVGGTVTWEFVDGTVPHNVVANDSSFKSEILTTGTFTHTFDKPGTFKYTCTIHPVMKASVTAVPAP